MATTLRVVLDLNVGHVVSRGLRRSWAAQTITLRAHVARATQQVIAGEPRLHASHHQRWNPRLKAARAAT
jgi:hypothetical protein